MRVVHVNTERGWRGGEQQLALLIEGLEAVASENDDLQQVLVAQRGGALAARAQGLPVVDVVDMKIGSSADLVGTARLRRLLRERTPDLLHLHTGHAHSVGTRAARWSGAARPRVILHRHVGYSPDRHPWPFGLHRLKFTWGVDRIVCVADSVRRRMEGAGITAAHLAVVPNGIDLRVPAPDPAAVAARRAAAGVGADGLLVGAVGALTPEKGHATLLDAFALLDPARTGLRLAIAGDGPLRPGLEERAAALGIEACVTFLGFVDDVAGLLPAFDLFCFPSLEEGAPVAVLQAMRAGVPILATTAGGIPEMIRDGRDGRLVPPADTAALSAALADLRDAPAQRALFARSAAQRVAATFDFHITARRMLAVYRSVLAAR